LASFPRSDVLSFSFLLFPGSIPDCVSALVQLEGLNLSRNKLVGHIPHGIGNLTNLQQLELSANSLSGEAHRFFVFSYFSSRICGNRNFRSVSCALTGPIPESIGQLTRLQWLSLSTNKLTGRIPESVGQLVQLSNMYLSENGLTGERICLNSRGKPVGKLTYLRTVARTHSSDNHAAHAAADAGAQGQPSDRQNSGRHHDVHEAADCGIWRQHVDG